MSVILNNVFELLHESEVELDNIFITNLFEGKIKTAAKLGAAGAAGVVAGKYAKGVYDNASAANIVDGKAVAKTASEQLRSAKDIVGGDIANAKTKALEMTNKTRQYIDSGQLKSDATQHLNTAKKFVQDNPVAMAVGGAVVGAGLLYKYFTSITHYKRKLASLESKLKSSPPERRQKIQVALNEVKRKLNEAQAKARIEHSGFIEKSHQIKAQIAELNKAGRKQDAMKLQEKLAKRQKFLSKIGATV